MEVPQLKITRKNSQERFLYNDAILKKAQLNDFWRWCCSDLVSNATRGILAEFIVAMAINRHKGVRNEWDAFDLTSKEGIKVEVKSAAYIQSWYQKDFSRIVFNIGKTKAWDPKKNRFERKSKRQADVYVFALLSHMDIKTIDPLNLNQWTFFVVSTTTLNRSLRDNKTLSLKRLRDLRHIECSYQKLNHTIKRAVSPSS